MHMSIHAVQHNSHRVSLHLGKTEITNYEGSDPVYDTLNSPIEPWWAPEIVLSREVKCITITFITLKITVIIFDEAHQNVDRTLIRRQWLRLQDLGPNAALEESIGGPR
jgi:hypothetical protein